MRRRLLCVRARGVVVLLLLYTHAVWAVILLTTIPAGDGESF